MKNNKILYILTLIITLFTFNTNVYAEEAVCTYKGTIKVDGKEETHEISIHYGYVKNPMGTDSPYVTLKEWDPKKETRDPNYKDNVAKDNIIIVDGSTTYNHKFGVDGVDANYMFNIKNGNCPSEIHVKRKDDGTKCHTTHTNITCQEIIDTTVYAEYKGAIDPKAYKFDSASGNNPITGKKLQSEAEIEQEKESESLDQKNDAKCTYIHEIEGSSEKHEIYMYYGKNENGIEFFDMKEYDPIKGNKKDGDVENTICYTFRFSWDEEFNTNYIFGTQSGECPQFIWVNRQSVSTPAADISKCLKDLSIITKVYKDSKKDTNGVIYYLDDTDGNNPLTGEDLSPDGNINIDIDLEMIDIKNCKDLFGDDAEEITGYFNIAWNIVKFGVPIILLALGTLDFAQAVFAEKDDGMKKAQGKFIKRIIIAIAIFLVPTLISFLLKIANGIWGNIGTDLCGLLF